MTIPQGLDPALAKTALQAIREKMRAREAACAMADDMRKDFRKFVVGAWDSVEPSKKLFRTWSIDAIAEHMQAVADGQISNIIINVPPGSCKSLLVSVMFPAWMWTRNPMWRSIFSAYESSVSTRDSVRCRDLMKSMWYQETFAPAWRFATAQDEKTYYYNTEKGFRMSTSVGGRSTGHRAHFLGVDDPINVTDQYSDAVIEQCIMWFDQSFSNRLIPDANGARALIMQRVSDRDLSGHLLRRGGWEHLVIPMRYDPSRSKVTVIKWKDPRTKRDELMCPEIFPKPAVDEWERTLGARAFAGQYQQSPAVEGGSILRSDKWNYWKPAGLILPKVRVRLPDGSIEERQAIDLPAKFDFLLQSWDCSFDGEESSDPVCGQVHGAVGANRFLIDQMHGRMTFTETKAAIRELTSRWPEAYVKVIEKKANGAAILDDLHDTIGGMEPVSPTEGKSARARAETPSLESGNWYIPHPLIKSWVGDPERPMDGGGFIGETAVFDAGVHDDMVDCWSQAAFRIRKENLAGVFGTAINDLRVEPFDMKLMEKWPRVFGMFVNYREVAAIWMCRQPETGQHYLYAEYNVAAVDPSQHAGDIRKQGDVPGYIVPDTGGRELKDGYAVARRYAQAGLRLETANENPEASVADFAEAVRTGKLKVFSNLPRFFDQYRAFRRDDKGKLPVYNVGVIRAALIAWRVRDQMRVPVPPKPAGGLALPRSWMAS